MFTKDEIQEYWHRCEKAARLLSIINSLIDDVCYSKDDAAKALMEYLDIAELSAMRINEQRLIL